MTRVKRPSSYTAGSLYQGGLPFRRRLTRVNIKAIKTYANPQGWG